MKHKKEKSNTPNYRKQLIQLAKFYGIIEIKNYFKSAKRLTNSQLELILIKNKIKLPSKKALSKIGRLAILKNKLLHQFLYTGVVAVIIVGFFGGIPYLVKNFHKVDSNLWNNKNEILKYKNVTLDTILNNSQSKSYKSEENLEELAEIMTVPNEQNDLNNNKVSLNSITIASLFQDQGYDLAKIRKGTKVKPFYFSLLPKDLSLIESVKKKKELFIKIVLPLILKENDQIKEDRKKLFKILAKTTNNKNDKNWLKWKFKEYKIKNSDISELKIRMDIIPVSLAIAQSAIETGWGTSRFALEGNALFGQWTYSSDGLKPLDVDTGNHKIMQFRILTASVRAYKKNLNTHNGYKKFRKERAALRYQNKKLDGLKLTKYLGNYAENGEDYIKIIELTIKQNSLADFENAKLLSTGLRKAINL